MCGLFGMVGFLEHKHRAALKTLGYFSALRGKDSTGLTVVSRNREVRTIKMTVPTFEFFEFPNVDKAMNFADQVWMGHARFKTQGSVNKANAHPFEIMDENEEVIKLIGTHNGTLTNKWEVENLLEGKPRFDTDSEALFHWLLAAPNYKEAISKLSGAWSLVWWRPADNAMYFCRNFERPFCFARSKDRKVFIYASEPWMITAACNRHNIELEADKKGVEVWSTLTDKLYRLDIPQERDKPIPDLVSEGGYTGAPVKKFQEPARYQHNIFGSDTAYDEEWWEGLDEKAKKTATKERKTNSGSGTDTVVTLGYPNQIKNGTIKGFNGAILSERQFKKIHEDGCAWCQQPIPEGIFFAFLTENELVCARCLRDTHSVAPLNDDYDPDLDDDLPLALTKEGKKLLTDQGTTAEAARIIAAVKKAVG